MYDAGRKAEADSVHNAYKERTRELARNVGEESILGAFLLNLYPVPAE